MDRGRWYRVERVYLDEEEARGRVGEGEDEELDDELDDDLDDDLDGDLDEDGEMNGNEGDMRPFHPVARQYLEDARAMNGNVEWGIPGVVFVPIPAEAQVRLPNQEPQPKPRNQHLIEDLQGLMRKVGAGQNGELPGDGFEGRELRGLAGQMDAIPEVEEEEKEEEIKDG